MGNESARPNFRWPEELDDLEGDLGELVVKKILTVPHGESLGDIQLELSNGQTSPETGYYFGADEPDTLEIDPTKKVIKLGAKCLRRKISEISIQCDGDSDSTKVTYGYGGKWENIDIPEGRKLVGVYGHSTG